MSLQIETVPQFQSGSKWGEKPLLELLVYSRQTFKIHISNTYSQQLSESVPGAKL